MPRIDDKLDRAAGAKPITAVAEWVAGEKANSTEGKSYRDGHGGVADSEGSVRKTEQIGAAAGVVGYIQVELNGSSDGASGGE